MILRKRYLPLVAIAGAATAAAAFAAPSESQTAPPSSASFVATDYDWSLADGSSSEVTVAVGATVTFGYPDGGSSHNVDFSGGGDTPSSCHQTAGAFTGETQPLPSSPSAAGWAGSCTFGEPGTYTFVCDLHPAMTGVIDVVDPNATTTTPTTTTGSTTTTTATTTTTPPTTTTTTTPTTTTTHTTPTTTTTTHVTPPPPPPPSHTTTTTRTTPVAKPPTLRVTLSGPKSIKRGRKLRVTYTATAAASASLTLTRGKAKSTLWKGKLAKGRHTISTTVSKRLSSKLVGAGSLRLAVTKPKASATAKLKVVR